MDSRTSSEHPSYLASGVARPVKVVVLGPFGVGKTTLVGTVSEIRPLTTEEQMTEAGQHIDDLRGLESKTTTTVAMDFGRLTLTEEMVLYLFGVPGQDRFAPMTKDLMEGALGGVVLVDTQRISESHGAMDLLEKAGLGYVVAVNHFPGTPRYAEEELREALDLEPTTPLLYCDVRQHGSAMAPLIDLVKHLIRRARLLEDSP
ncbi:MULTISPECIES: ATP/GTP-binding protein [Streptomyces]|uniref:ATP/GTP-binding protein n=1 Tax=Streptomyces lycii TaxID=2654337 RepID=A0ABQ7FKM9_9ACTN|nr:MULTISPECIES: ATP/GTP-binding protein [Streptomyces]KAF4409524.1 ATP/GTP-binding protein [Streptomyces lycii]PGH50466.1 ATP-binding protein [Streptomyces sp. Ru87]